MNFFRLLTPRSGRLPKSQVFSEFRLGNPAAIVTLHNFISLHSQTFFDDLWTKFETYQAGEDLFGMPKTEYQELHKVKKELYMLQKLYSLYNSVNNSINGYYDILWSEVDIDKINNELQDFQSRWVTLFGPFG